MSGMKIITKTGLAACISSGPMDHVPEPGRGMEMGIMLLPWATQEEAVWSKMDQNGMTNAIMERIFRMCRVSVTAFSPQSRVALFQPPRKRTVKSTRQKPPRLALREGGILLYSRRPSQKTKVAIPMKMPGTAKAQL